MKEAVQQDEVHGNRSEAIHIAKSTFDEAVSELDTLSEDSYKDSTLIMQQLRDCLTLWAVGEEEEKQPGKTDSESISHFLVRLIFSTSLNIPMGLLNGEHVLISY